MTPKSLVLVYHPKCQASTDLIVKIKQLKLEDIETEFINIAGDKIETSIEINKVPLLIVDNNENFIFIGKDAFDKIDEINRSNNSSYGKSSSGGLKYGTGSTFVPDESSSSKKKGIDLSEKPNI
jgi:hypothetical protein